VFCGDFEYFFREIGGIPWVDRLKSELLDDLSQIL